MEHLGINVNVKNVPELDPKYIPLHKFNAAFLEGAKKPLGIAVERAGGEVAVLRTFIPRHPRLRGRGQILRRPHGKDHALALRRLEGIHLRRRGHL